MNPWIRFTRALQFPSNLGSFREVLLQMILLRGWNQSLGLQVRDPNCTHLARSFDPVPRLLLQEHDDESAQFQRTQQGRLRLLFLLGLEAVVVHLG